MSSVEQLLSRRLLRSSQGRRSRPIVRLAVAGIAVCLLVMILAISISTGYRNAIEQKVIDMGSHIRITHNEDNRGYDGTPIDKDPALLSQLRGNPDVAHLQFAATKCGVVKTDDQVEGIVLKGIDETFDWKAFGKNMEAGTPLALGGDTVTKGVIVSRTLANRLHLRVGDKLPAYFWNDGRKYDRAFRVAGIYNTGMPEYDSRFILGDIRHIRKINGWTPDQVGCIEVLINDYDKLDQVGDYVHHSIGYDLQAQTIREMYPQIFEWTDLFDTNVTVLLAITMFVCLITLISTFFIIILEQTSSIGILKSMGMTTRRLRNVFVRLGLRLILIGLVIGNVVGFTICLLQKYLHIIKLDEAAYYVPYVPIGFNWPMLLAVNAGVLVVCVLVLLIPATFVAKRITPVSAIKFE
ncbi:MAG: ABC transporter permease [Bacteroidales bacterium]|nr:ABC transporter permease [Bacteroidales bacterium]